MSTIEELKLTTLQLCNAIDGMIECERYFCNNLCYEIEKMTWDVYRITNELKELNQYIGI